MLTKQELHAKCLKLVLLRSSGPDWQKKKHAKKVEKAAKEGRLRFDVPKGDEAKTWLWRLCNARMMLGHFEDYTGWEFRNDWATNCWYNRPINTPMWVGEKVEKLIVMGEQGIGDEIMFAQCLREIVEYLGHKNIVLETEERLIPIFERAFGIKCIAREPTTTPRDAPWICLGDLLRLCRNGTYWNGKPYLTPDPERVKEFEWARGKIAVSWEGRHGRYDPEAFEKVLGSDVIDLQYNDIYDGFIQPGIDKRNDLEGILALLSVCSHVVSVSTTLVHLAAASGVPVHLVVAPAYSGPNYDQLQWRWGMGEERTKWYDSVRIYPNLKVYESLYVRKSKRRSESLGRRSEVAVYN